MFWKWQLHRLYLVWECWVGSIVEFLTSKLLIIFSINKSKIWLLCTITSMQHIWVCFRKDTFQSNQVWLVGFDTTLHFSFKESLKGCVKSNWIFCVRIDTNMSISQSCILMSHWGHMMVCTVKNTSFEVILPYRTDSNPIGAHGLNLNKLRVLLLG